VWYIYFHFLLKETTGNIHNLQQSVRIHTHFGNSQLRNLRHQVCQTSVCYYMSHFEYKNATSTHTRLSDPASLRGMLNFLLLLSFIPQCLTLCPQPLPKRVLQKVRASTSSFKFQYSHLSLMASSNCLRLLHCLPVTSIPSSIFPSVMCFRSQFLRKI
jgi:hypothetical protein